MLKKHFALWVESYLYTPTPLQKLLSFLLIPLSLLYEAIINYKYSHSQEEDLGVKIIGIGNLIVGGSGKTPLLLAVAPEFPKVAVVLRGYGRKSQGLHVVSDAKNILCDVAVSGDEAMIYAKRLKHTVVIVSEDRVEGIERAKKLGATVIFLDDAYAKHHIKKLDVLIGVSTLNQRCLPSGPYREKRHEGKNILDVVEGKDFHREVSFLNKKERMALVTAIARPQRLDKYLCEGVVSKYYFEDHHDFTFEEVNEIFQHSDVESLLVTYKDYVKLAKFNLPLTLMDLNVRVEKNIIKTLKDYVEEKN